MNQAELCSSKKVSSVRRLQAILKAMQLSYSPETDYGADLIDSIDQVNRLMVGSKITAVEAVKSLSLKAVSESELDDVCDGIELQESSLSDRSVAIANRLGEQNGMAILTLANIVTAQVVTNGGRGVKCPVMNTAYEQSRNLLKTACSSSSLGELLRRLNTVNPNLNLPITLQLEELSSA